MADVSVTAASVLKGTGALYKEGIAGATILQGQWLYMDTSNLLQLGVNNSTAVKAVIVGVALTGGAINQPVLYQYSGPYTAGGTLVAGLVYVLSATNGGMALINDIASTNYISILGVSTTTAVLNISINNTGGTSSVQAAADVT